MKTLLFLVTVFLLLTSYFSRPSGTPLRRWLILPLAQADEYQDLQKLLDQKINDLGSRQKEQNLTQSQKDKVSKDVAEVKSLVARAAAEIEKKKKQILDLDRQRSQRQEDLADRIDQSNFLVARIYKTSLVSPVDLFLGSGTFGQLSQSLTYYRGVMTLNQEKVRDLGGQVVRIKVSLIENRERKADLEKEIISLSQKRKILDEKLLSLTSQLSSLGSQISNLQGEIAQISARQRQILAEKPGSFQTSVGEVPAADDPASRLDYDPGFRSAFAGFSFGAPHRKGLSQYGA